MTKQQLIEKWTKEMADIKNHIKEHEDIFGHPSAMSRERLETISEMLADIKTSCINKLQITKNKQ